jgi:adenine-specific DNA-methyltransferase
MNTIFIGGSRHISQLPPEIKKRLDNVVASGHQVIVGDANGADKAVQKHFLDKHYEKVTVFCSGATPRNNLRPWLIHQVDAPKRAKGFHFYAAKDREMARKADFGLMIWDGKSPGTVLNVFRLALAGKIAVLFNVSDKDVVNIKSVDALRNFIAHCSEDLLKDVKERATLDELQLLETTKQPAFVSTMEEASSAQASEEKSVEPAHSSQSQALALGKIIETLNNALASADAAAIKEALGQIARDREICQVTTKAELARERLYQSLNFQENPEIIAIIKLLSSVGLQLEIKFEKNESELEVVGSKG